MSEVAFSFVQRADPAEMLTTRPKKNTPQITTGAAAASAALQAMHGGAHRTTSKEPSLWSFLLFNPSPPSNIPTSPTTDSRLQATAGSSSHRLSLRGSWRLLEGALGWQPSTGKVWGITTAAGSAAWVIGRGPAAAPAEYHQQQQPKALTKLRASQAQREREKRGVVRAHVATDTPPQPWARRRIGGVVVVAAGGRRLIWRRQWILWPKHWGALFP
jgi:hypothetical protein